MTTLSTVSAIASISTLVIVTGMAIVIYQLQTAVTKSISEWMDIVDDMEQLYRDIASSNCARVTVINTNTSAVLFDSDQMSQPNTVESSTAQRVVPSLNAVNWMNLIKKGQLQIIVADKGCPDTTQYGLVQNLATNINSKLARLAYVYSSSQSRFF